MMLSTRGRYGVKALYELAASEGEAPVPLKTIAKRQGLSQDYLEQLMAVLRRAGLVKSFRGSRGGYALGMPPSSITVGRIVRVMEGTIAPTDCVGDGPVEHCGCPEGCVARGVWERVASAVSEVLDSISLADLVDEAKTKDCLGKGDLGEKGIP